MQNTSPHPPLLNQNLYFTKLPKWLKYSLNFENHWLLGKQWGRGDTEPCCPSHAMALLGTGLNTSQPSGEGGGHSGVGASAAQASAAPSWGWSRSAFPGSSRNKSFRPHTLDYRFLTWDSGDQGCSPHCPLLFLMKSTCPFSFFIFTRSLQIRLKSKELNKQLTDSYSSNMQRYQIKYFPLSA